MSTYLTDDELKRSKELLDRIQKIFSERVVGQENLRETLIVGLLAQGHILMESVPGLAKTTAAQTIAQAISGSFHRIQCTPDLMPNDIVGTRIWNQAENEMTTELGPVHANIVLLDEINRSSAKLSLIHIYPLEDFVVEFVALVFDAMKLVTKCDSLFGGSGVDMRKNFDSLDKLARLLGEEFEEVWALRSVPDPHNVPPIVLRLPQGNRHPLHTGYSSSL